MRNSEILVSKHFADNAAALRRLEEYLVAEFPLEISEGDILTDRAIEIMKKMKRQIGVNAVADQIFLGSRDK